MESFLKYFLRKLFALLGLSMRLLHQYLRRLRKKAKSQIAVFFNIHVPGYTKFAVFFKSMYPGTCIWKKNLATKNSDKIMEASKFKRKCNMCTLSSKTRDFFFQIHVPGYMKFPFFYQIHVHDTNVHESEKKNLWFLNWVCTYYISF